MNEIIFYKAGSKDAQTLAELRTRFAIELTCEQRLGKKYWIYTLHIQ